MAARSAPVLWTSLAALIGCAGEQAVRTPAEPAPNYARQLPEGRAALRLITDPARLPDLAEAYRGADALLVEAVGESLLWLAAPSSRQFFPFDGITHGQARASLVAMRELFLAGSTAAVFAAEAARLFDIYESVGYDGRGTVLFTGYYAPVFRASRAPSGPFAYVSAA